MAVITVHISRALAYELANELDGMSGLSGNRNGYLFDSFSLKFNVDEDGVALDSCVVHPKSDGFEISVE